MKENNTWPRVWDAFINERQSNQPTLMKSSTLAFLSLTAAFFSMGLNPLRAESVGAWTSSVKNTRQSLAYSADMPLLGQPTPVAVVFGCDPTWDKESSGTLGFDVSIRNPAKIKTFAFNDFEGPDAEAAAEVRVTLTRKDKSLLSFQTTASGGFSELDVFTFHVSEVSKTTQSVPRSILQALAQNEAESLKIAISDPRNPKHSLELTLPVTGQQAKFKTLLTGLK